MKQIITIILLASVSAVATGVALGAGSGSGDIQEVSAGVAVFAGLMAIATPNLMKQNGKS